MTWLDDIRSRVDTVRVRKVAHAAASGIVTVANLRTVTGVAKVAAVVEALSDGLDKLDEDGCGRILRRRGYKPGLWVDSKQVFEILEAQPSFRSQKFGSDQMNFVSLPLDVAWVSSDSDGAFLYARGSAEDVTAAISGHLWLRSSRLILSDDVDDFPRPDPREMAVDRFIGAGTYDRLAARIKAFTDRGFTRSLLLYGPPGTGKSLLAFVLTQGLRTLRVVLSDDVEVGRGFFEKMNALRPEALVIEDIDRLSTNCAGFLELMEHANRTCKVVIGTANVLDRLEGAVMRVGRFDEVIEIATLDQEVVDALIGDVPPEARARMVTWTAATLHEFARRRDALGLEVALSEMDELEARQQPEEPPPD